MTPKKVLGKRKRDTDENLTDLNNPKRIKLTEYSIEDLQLAFLQGNFQIINAALSQGLLPDRTCIKNAITQGKLAIFELAWANAPNDIKTLDPASLPQPGNDALNSANIEDDVKSFIIHAAHNNRVAILAGFLLGIYKVNALDIGIDIKHTAILESLEKDSLSETQIIQFILNNFGPYQANGLKFKDKPPEVKFFILLLNFTVVHSFHRAIANSHFNVLYFLIHVSKIVGRDHILAQLEHRAGDGNIIKLDYSIYYFAIITGNIKLFCYLMDTFHGKNNLSWQGSFFRQLAIMQYTPQPELWYSQIFVLVAGHGQLDMFKWLCANLYKFISPITQAEKIITDIILANNAVIYNLAVASGNIEFVQWLMQQLTPAGIQQVLNIKSLLLEGLTQFTIIGKKERAYYSSIDAGIIPSPIYRRPIAENLPKALSAVQPIPNTNVYNMLSSAIKTSKIALVEYFASLVPLACLADVFKNSNLLQIVIQQNALPMISWILSKIQLINPPSNSSPVQFFPLARVNSTQILQLSFSEYITLLRHNNFEMLITAQQNNNISFELLINKLPAKIYQALIATNCNYLYEKSQLLIKKYNSLETIFDEIRWDLLTKKTQKSIVWFLSYILCNFSPERDVCLKLLTLVKNNLGENTFKGLAHLRIPAQLDNMISLKLTVTALGYAYEYDQIEICHFFSTLYTPEELQDILTKEMRDALSTLAGEGSMQALAWFFKNLPYLSLTDCQDPKERAGINVSFLVGMLTAMLSKHSIAILDAYYQAVPVEDLKEILTQLMWIYYNIKPEEEDKRYTLMQWLVTKFGAKEIVNAIDKMPVDPYCLQLSEGLFDDDLFDKLKPLCAPKPGPTRETIQQYLLDKQLISPEDARTEFSNPEEKEIELSSSALCRLGRR